MLEEYEDKLRLFEKFGLRQEILELLTKSIKDEASTIEYRLELVKRLKETD